MRRSWLRLFLTGVLLLAAVVGWLVGSGTGPRWLHRELEARLSRRFERAVSVAAVDLRIERGLRLALRNLRIQPTADARGEPLLRAGRVVAWIDIPALLIGRLALSTLVLESPSLHIERAADGSLRGLPRWPLDRGDPRDRNDRNDAYGEDVARGIEALEPIAQKAAERLRFASRIEIRDGTLSFLDRARSAGEATVRLELVELVAERDWLSEAGSLELEAIVVDGRNAPFPISFGVRREEAEPFVWDLAWEGVSLAAARQLVPSLPLLNGLSGRWSAKLHASREATGENRLSLESRVENASLVLPRSKRQVAYDALDLKARIELARDELRLLEGQLGGRRIRSDFDIALERPLRPASRARLATRLVGVELEDVRSLVDPLQNEFEAARSIASLIEPVESGQIQQIEASGTATLHEWQTLWRGPERDLPAGFLLAGRFDQVTFAGDSRDGIQDLSGEVEWLGDRLVLRDARARFRDVSLPRMNLAIDGVSHLVRASRTAAPIRAHPPAIPGLRPLARILRPRDPNALPPVKAIGLALDRLEHPLLRWPLTDARVLIEPVRRGVQIKLREGILGGASVSGEVVWSSEPDDGQVTAELSFTDPPPQPGGAPPASQADGELGGADAFGDPGSPPGSPPVALRTTASQAVWPEARWGAGRVELEFRPRPKLPFARATGYFRLDGSDFVARDVEIALAPEGTIETRGVVGLEAPETVGLDLSFALTDGRFESLSEFIALPPKLLTGGLGATGTLAGRVRPDTPFIAELDGKIRAEAKEGRVALAVPLLLRLTRATEGYNPFAKEDEVGYETMEATIELTHGRLDSQDFRIEGPLRVYAKARIDTNPRPVEMRAVVGIFLFRAPNEILSNVPILRALLPGSERGLVGAYFRVDGPLKEPEIEALPLATFLTAVPSAIKTPMKVLQYLFNGGDSQKSGKSGKSEASPPPEPTAGTADEDA